MPENGGSQAIYTHTCNERALGTFSSGEMNAVEGKEGQRPQETQRAWGEPLEAQTSAGKGQVSYCNRKAGREGQGRDESPHSLPAASLSLHSPATSAHVC